MTFRPNSPHPGVIINQTRVFFGPAAAGDASGIKSLVQSSSVHSHSRRHPPATGRPHKRRPFLSRLLSPVFSSGLDWAEFLIAKTESGDIIGCARIKHHPGNIHEIATVSILKSWRGKGLFQCGAAYLLENLPRPLWGTCLTGYLPLYLKSGAREVTDSRQLPPVFRCRRWFFNAFLRLLGSRKRLTVILFP